MSFTVIYRIGGTENFEWRKCIPVSTKEEAIRQKESLEKMGYKALIHNTDSLERIGMPETW